MRIHLGHHFYGAGNLGDDFMLAGFLGAMRTLAPDATLTCCVPFPLEPLRRRFPSVTWHPYEEALRTRCIAESDVWLGLGGSPFQSAQSRWFIDHLNADAALCRTARKRMFFLGVGAQTEAELLVPDVRTLCGEASGIWTRDFASAQRLSALDPGIRATPGSDLAHLFFREHRPPPPAPRRLTFVANFDYASWDAAPAFLQAVACLAPSERVWLAQESRDLPGAERAIFSSLATPLRAGWALISPELPGAPLADVLARWPTGEWLLTSRFHAAIAAAWAGSRIVVIATNEKLRAIGRELGCPVVPPDADTTTVSHALASALPVRPPLTSAERAYAACREFVSAAGT
ncbi:hypothetical protein DB354_14875 [Opitutus sp. ER46]|nr:hypothetical protein DB354_14875 [Opitutus sp. ER46]